MTAIRMTVALMFLIGLSACGGDSLIERSCDEPQRYQFAVDGKRVVAPEGLDSLDRNAEMPIPKSKDAPERPPGSPCIELPPAAGSGQQ